MNCLGDFNLLPKELLPGKDCTSRQGQEIQPIKRTQTFTCNMPAILLVYQHATLNFLFFTGTTSQLESGVPISEGSQILLCFIFNLSSFFSSFYLSLYISLLSVLHQKGFGHLTESLPSKQRQRQTQVGTKMLEGFDRVKVSIFTLSVSRVEIFFFFFF